MNQSTKTNQTSVAIIKAMGMFGGVKMVTIICSLIRNKLIAWLIGPAGMGLIILYNSIVELVSVSTRLSIDQSALRDIASSPAGHRPYVVKTINHWCIALGLAGSVIMCALSPLLSYWSFGTTGRWSVFCMLSVVPFCITVAALLIGINQGLRRLARAAKATTVGAVLGLFVAVPLIVWLRIDSIEWIIISYGICGAIGALIYRARTPRVTMSASEIFRGGTNFIRLGFKMTIAAVFTYVANYTFVLFLNNYASTSVLGMYQAGYTLVNTYVNVILTGIWMEFFPRLAAQAHSPRRMAVSASHEIAVTMWILMPFLCAFVTFGAPAIQIIYSSTFLDALPFVTIGSVSIILRAASWSISYIILARGDGNIYIVTEAASSLAGLGLNIAGYVLGGFAGVGVSYILWYAFYTLLVGVVCRRRYGISIDTGVTRLVVIAVAVVTTAVVAAIFISPFASGVVCAVALYFSWRHRFGTRKNITAS